MTDLINQRPGKAASTLQTIQRYYYNPPITRNEVITGLRALGFQHLESVPIRGSARIPARGKPPSNRSTSVKYSDDGIVCHWQEWTSGDKGTLFAERRPEVNTVEIARRIQKDKIKTKQAEVERERNHLRVAKQAQALYRHGATVGEHSYIERKQLGGLHNARIDEATGALLIPMWVSGIGLVNIQRIYRDGTKRYLKDGRVNGAYSVIGSLLNAKRVLVAEGWVTACTLYELHGLTVVVAFSAGNLLTVCQALRSQFAGTVIVAGDDDRQTPGNPGRAKAIQAAESIGATVAFPKLCKCCQCTDHNDAAVCARRYYRG